MPLNFDLAGKTYDEQTATITAEAIEAYAEASGDANPRYRADADDQVAPPVFSVVPGFPLMGGITADPDLGVDNPLMIVHGGQEFVYHRPIRPGDTLVMVPTLDSVVDKGRNAVYVAKIAFRDIELTPVVDQYWTIVVRGGGSGGERPASGSEPIERDDVVTSFTRHVDEDMPQRYAEASGDHNPIHLDENTAKMVGLPGVINHGLGSLSLVAGGLVEHLADGDPTRLASLGCRFTDMVFPGSDLDTTVWQADDHRAFETTRPDDTAVIVGSVAVD
ncbi:MAG: MaoC/PaaZ C-terminal domain-containing protein [Acidimicrobiia bacterium]|nr:MaoC/PaaZ C-terminal domain-containing protein [Acidimicrobiia bacterium]